MVAMIQKELSVRLRSAAPTARPSRFSSCPGGRQPSVVHRLQRLLRARDALRESIQNFLPALGLRLRKVRHFPGIVYDCRGKAPGNDAICSANWPNENDFGCGFQPSLLSGIRSRTRFAVCASWSSSLQNGIYRSHASSPLIYVPRESLHAVPLSARRRLARRLFTRQTSLGSFSHVFLSNVRPTLPYSLSVAAGNESKRPRGDGMSVPPSTSLRRYCTFETTG